MKNPHKVLWVVTVVVVIMHFFINGDAVGIQLNDTYIVLSKLHVTMFLSSLMIFSGFGFYFLRDYQLNKWLSLVYIFLILTVSQIFMSNIGWAQVMPVSKITLGFPELIIAIAIVQLLWLIIMLQAWYRGRVNTAE